MMLDKIDLPSDPAGLFNVNIPHKVLQFQPAVENKLWIKTISSYFMSSWVLINFFFHFFMCKACKLSLLVFSSCVTIVFMKCEPMKDQKLIRNHLKHFYLSQDFYFLVTGFLQVKVLGCFVLWFSAMEGKLAVFAML